MNIESNSDIKVTYNLSLTIKVSSVEIKILHLGLFTIFNVHLIVKITYHLQRSEISVFFKTNPFSFNNRKTVHNLAEV